MNKRLLSMILVLCMIFNLSPVSVMAEEIDMNQETVIENVYDSEVEALELMQEMFNPMDASDVAQIDVTGYKTLQAAFDAVTDGQTIKLLVDINLTATVTIGSENDKKFILDLNGKTLDSGNNMAIQHNGTGTLTIKDTGTDGKITSVANISSNGTIDLRGGILVVESGTIENTRDNIDANAILKDHYYNGTVIVTGGTIVSTKGTAIYYGYLPYSSEPTSSSGILIPSGTPIIKGDLKSMNEAPDLSSYTNVKVTASSNYDGSSLVTYDPTNITNYKYLKFEPGPIPSVLTGTATISNTSPRIGDVLTGLLLVHGNNIGTLTYIWKVNGTNVGTDESYTVTVEDLGKTITLEISSEVETGTITSNATAAVLKKRGPSTPDAPTLVSKTHNTVTLKANAAYEFSKDNTKWQTSNVFSGLSPKTTYTFYQRISETSDTESSVASEGFSVTTNSNDSRGSDSGIGNSNSGSESSSDISIPVIITPPTPDKPNSPTQAEIRVPGTAEGKDNITVKITNKTVTYAFDKALADAKKNGNEQNGITVLLRIDTDTNTGSNVTVNLPKTVQETIIAKKIVNTIVVVDNPGIRIGMDLRTVKEINKQANSDVNITAIGTNSDKLTGNAKKAIGSRPVFQLKVNYGSGKQVQDFGTGSVSVTIPYTLGANEKAENVCAVYVDGRGKVHWLVNSVYDSVNKVLRFSTNHFSTYGVGYKEDALAFTDITSHWAKEDIEFVVRHGMFGGTSDTTFSPNTAMTRGMFVTVLGRLANTDVSSYNESSFNDVKSDAYYMGYIEWASKNNIVNGTGNGNFAPDQAITREQMAVIISNYAKTMDLKLTQTHGEKTFEDSTKISIYAKDAVKQMQMVGVIRGKKGNIFDPHGTSTRAEVSAVLHLFVELVSSGDTM